MTSETTSQNFFVWIRERESASALRQSDTHVMGKVKVFFAAIVTMFCIKRLRTDQPNPAFLQPENLQGCRKINLLPRQFSRQSKHAGHFDTMSQGSVDQERTNIHLTSVLGTTKYETNCQDLPNLWVGTKLQDVWPRRVAFQKKKDLPFQCGKRFRHQDKSTQNLIFMRNRVERPDR